MSAEPSQQQPPPQSPDDCLRILVADDDAEVLSLIGDILSTLGHSIIAAKNGAQAWDIVQKDAEFDLVIADIEMPRLSGLALLRKMREARLETPVAIIAGCAEISMVLASVKLQAFDFLIKPVGFDQLQALLERVRIMPNRNQHSLLFSSGGLQSLQQIIRIQSRCDILPGVIRQVMNELASVTQAKEFDQTQIANLLTEALRNAILHGNLALPSSLFRQDPTRYMQLVAERENNPEFRDREVSISLSLDSHQLEICVSDCGEGFDHRQLKKSDDALSLLESKGLALIRHSADAVHWNERGNAITMRFERCPIDD